MNVLSLCGPESGLPKNPSVSSVFQTETKPSPAWLNLWVVILTFNPESWAMRKLLQDKTNHSVSENCALPHLTSNFEMQQVWFFFKKYPN